MTWAGRLFRLFAGNAVPGGGFLFVGWSPATALTLYWIDNVVSAIAMGVRIALHRRWTRASGHDRGQIGATMTFGKGEPQTFRSFLAEFLLASIAFSIGHAIFLAFLLSAILEQLPERNAVREGAAAIVISHGLALIFDTRQLDAWPFAKLKDQATRVMGRIVVVHMTILAGMVFLAARGTPGAFFSVFAGLKLLADIGSIVPQYKPHEPPRLLVWLTDLFPKQNGESFTDYWRRTRVEAQAQDTRDEQPRK